MANNTNTSLLHQTVMRRVYTLYVLRFITNTTTFATLAATGALFGVGREVWVARVFQNMPSIFNPGAVLNFYVDAFLDTRLIVQLLVAIVFVGFFYASASLTRICFRISVEIGLFSRRNVRVAS